MPDRDGTSATTRRALLGWDMVQRPGFGRLAAAEIPRCFAASATVYGQEALGSVHEVLYAHGVIPDPRACQGQAASVWVAEHDWLYRCRFAHPGAGQVRLCCAGLDTIVDIWLNGILIHEHRSCYLPLVLELPPLREDNELVLHVQAPLPWIARDAAAQAWQAAGVAAGRCIRKPLEDFNFFNGAHPSFTAMGPFAPLYLERVPVAALDQWELSAELGETQGIIRCRPLCYGQAWGYSLTVYDPAGTCVGALRQAGTGPINLTIAQPQCWWPNGYGAQALYTVVLEVLDAHNEVIDRAQRRVAFRNLELSADFRCHVNGVRVHLWGVNLTPLPSMSHRCDTERLALLLRLAQDMHCTTIRAWGPGQPWPEALLDDADELGLLVWAEFAHTGGPWPRDAAFQEACAAEARSWITRWRHHPSLLCWCGGNETFLGLDSTQEETLSEHTGLFGSTYRQLVAELDPGRRYLVNSPHGGPFANSAAFGDTHVRTYEFWLSGHGFPNLIAETARTTMPLLKTLQRHLGHDVLWPAGFDGVRRQFSDAVVPPTWVERLAPSAHWLANRLGPVEELFETGDTPQGLIDRIGTAAALYIRRSVERYRRGRASASGERQVRGHYWWKFNDTFPMIYASLVDDLFEPNQAYYAMRRAYRPVLASIVVADRIEAWVVNDTPRALSGALVLQQRDADGVQVRASLRFPVQVPAGESRLVGVGDDFQQFSVRSLLVASLCDDTGHEWDHTCEWLCPERQRWVPAPGPHLEITQCGEALVLRSTSFAGRVQLSGETPGGDAFGWYFSDNFLDMVPGRDYHVRVLGSPATGTIRAHSPWCRDEGRCAWHRCRAHTAQTPHGLLSQAHKESAC